MKFKESTLKQYAAPLSETEESWIFFGFHQEANADLCS